MKVKHLIEKLSKMDPEASVYVGEGGVTVNPVRYAHKGVHFKKSRIFLLSEWFDLSPGLYSDKDYLQKLMDYNKIKASDIKLVPEDVFLTSWNGKFGDD